MGKRSLRWLVGRALDGAIWRPSRMQLVRDQLLNVGRNARRGYTDTDHLRAAAEWLARAQDASGDNGVMGRYGLATGWSSSYPETTGYIIPTFLTLAKEMGPAFRERARRCVEFLSSVQLPSGAFPGAEIAENRTEPSVFNTAQILNGLTAWHMETGDSDVAKRASRAADWLVSQQDPDGAWRKAIHGGVTSYTAHASCWLAEAGEHFGNDAWKRSAERHMDWVLTCVDPTTGWIDLAGFTEEDNRARRAVTHTLAYTIWGILHSSLILKRADATQVARTAAEGVMRRLELSGWLPGEIGVGWKAARTDYACVTGNAQMALIWLRLAEIDGDPRFTNAALKALDRVAAAQPMENPDLGIRGGIPGSAPVWGDYIYMSFPNWAAKFYIDALFAKRRALELNGHPSPTPWSVPADDSQSLPPLSPAAQNTARVVLLTSFGSHKVPQMVRAWSSWGFKPAAVVAEPAPVDPPLSARVAARFREQGIVEPIRASLRKRSATSAPQPSDPEPKFPDVVSFCRENGIHFIEVPSLRTPEGLALVRDLEADVFVHAGAAILRSELLAVPRLGTLNAHMGILPRYRGMNVSEWARLEGAPVGCTVHLIDAGIDTGDILVIREVATAEAKSIGELRDLVDRAQIGLLGDVIRHVVVTGALPARRSQAREEGRQYFRMHHEMKRLLTDILRTSSAKQS